jgi:hypothetical protein
VAFHHPELEGTEEVATVAAEPLDTVKVGELDGAVPFLGYVVVAATKPSATGSREEGSDG